MIWESLFTLANCIGDGAVKAYSKSYVTQFSWLFLAKTGGGRTPPPYNYDPAVNNT